MTERENFFAIARRKDYERMPVQFNLCPYLQQTCGEKIRALQEETGFVFSPRCLPTACRCAKRTPAAFSAIIRI